MWLFGAAAGVQVWGVEGDSRVWGSVLIGDAGPIVLLNLAIAGCQSEHRVLDWALARIATGEPGFFVLSSS